MNLRGFTLLEVMVALAILAIGLTTLLSSQNQSMFVAEETDFSFISATLAKAKMAELLAEEDPFDESGDFGDRFSHYYWKSEIHEVDFSESELLAGSGELLRRIDLTVHTENERRSATISRYVLVGGAP
jgi:general secretion pathway protein I